MYEYTKNNKYMYVFLISTFCVFFVFVVFLKNIFFLLFVGLFCGVFFKLKDFYYFHIFFNFFFIISISSLVN